MAYAKFGILSLDLELIQLKPEVTNQGVAISTIVLPQYSVRGINSFDIALVPEPDLISVTPLNVFNPVDFTTVTVHGADFGGHSACVFDTTAGTVLGKVAVVKPISVINDSKMVCRTDEIMKGKRGGQPISLSVSNDGGRTLSSSLEIQFRTNLPRLLDKAGPTVLFADNDRADIRFTGTNLYTGIKVVLTKTDDSS